MAVAGHGGDRGATDHLHDAEILVHIDGPHGLVRQERLFGPLDRALDDGWSARDPGRWLGRPWLVILAILQSGTVPGINGTVDLDRFNGSSLPASLLVP